VNQNQAGCLRCGASVPVPPELEAVVMRCPYCQHDQPVPDLVTRQRALQARRQGEAASQAAALHVRSIQKTTSGIMTMVFIFVALILVVVFGVVGIILYKTL
jgi:hypothetical protein